MKLGKFIATFIVSFLISTPLVQFISAQGNNQVVETVPGVVIQTSIDKAEIYIGDLVEYKLTIIYDSTIELIPPPLGGNLGAFDVKDYTPDIETKLDNGRIQSDNTFILSTFTTGDYVIPSIPISFTLANGNTKVMYSESVPIKVLSLLFNADDDQEIKPLKPQYEFKRDYTWHYVIGSLILILLLILGIFIRKRMLKSDEVLEPVDLRPAWEIAFEKLAFLKQHDYINKSEFKNYYIELTEIARHFYEKVYEQNFMDMTTEEFLSTFKELEIADSLYIETKSFLRHADLVKFAKYIPELKRTEDDYEMIHQMIDKVRIEILEKEKEQLLIEAQKEKTNTIEEPQPQTDANTETDEVSS